MGPSVHRAPSSGVHFNDSTNFEVGFFPLCVGRGAHQPEKIRRGSVGGGGGVENQSSNYVSYGMEDFFPEKVLLPATSCDDDGDEDAAAWQ